MADLVRNVNGIEEQVQSVVSGIREIANARPVARSFSLQKIVRGIFNAVSPVSASIAHSEQFALLPADRRSINE
jgi:hypothetical protein